MQDIELVIECLRKRDSQIPIHKKCVGQRNIVDFHKIKVTNSTIFSNFVERFHKLSPLTFSFDWSSILWKIDSSFASPFPSWIPQIKCGLFFVEFRFVNSAFANTLFRFRKHSNHIMELTLKSYNTQNMHVDNQTYPTEDK